MTAEVVSAEARSQRDSLFINSSLELGYLCKRSRHSGKRLLFCVKQMPGVYHAWEVAQTPEMILLSHFRFFLMTLMTACSLCHPKAFSMDSGAGFPYRIKGLAQRRRGLRDRRDIHSQPHCDACSAPEDRCCSSAFLPTGKTARTFTIQVSYKVPG